MKYSVKDESFVAIGTNAVKMRYPVKKIEKVFFDDGKKYIEYTEGKDYEIKDGLIIPLPGTSLPDYRKAPLFALKPFDQDKIPNFMPWDYILFANYETDISEKETLEFFAKKFAEKKSVGALKEFLESKRGGTLNYTVFGDSISTGCESSTYEKAFFSLFKDAIEKKYDIKINMTNCSVGGDTSEMGRNRFDKVISVPADLVTIGFGMNDQNIMGIPENPHIDVPKKRYLENISYFTEEFIKRGAKVVLVSPCNPHTDWIHTSGHMADYIDALRIVAKKYKVPFANVNALWNHEFKFKSQEDVLRNGINHPTNYGHIIYAAALKELI